MSKRPLQWMAALALLGVIAGACSNGGSTNTGSNKNTQPNGGTGLYPASQLNKAQHTGTPKRGGTMKFGIESTILNYSPNQSVIQPSDLALETSVFDSLITYNDQNTPVLDNSAHKYNQLADSLTADKVNGTANGKSWTLKLRPGIKFSNGVALTAQEVVDHTNWIIQSGTCSCNADAQNIASVTADGDLTVHYELKDANVAWPTKLANTGLAWITESGARKQATNQASPDTKHLIGTGPFVFESAVNSDYTVVKNPNYYGTDAANGGAKLPYLDKIEFTPLADTATRLQAVQSNGVQIMQTADTSNLVNAKKDSNLTVQPISGSSSTILVLRLDSLPFGVTPKPGESLTDTSKRALADPNALLARTAFETGINRNEINQKYYKGARVPAYSFIPDTSPYYDPKGQLPRYDLAKAKSLVASAKAKGLKMDVNSICIPGPESTGIFQILQQQGEASGINAHLTTVEQSVLVSTMLQHKATGQTKNWNVACFRSPQLSDPDGVYGSLYTNGPTNLTSYSRANVDKNLDAGRSVIGIKNRKPHYDIVQEQVAKDIVVIPLLFDYYGNVHQSNVSGLGHPMPDALGLISLASLYYKQ